MSICTISLGFSIANLRYCLFLILHSSRMFNPCLFSILYIVLVLSDISFSLFNLNLMRLHPNLFVIRRFSISCSISFVTFTGCILCGFLYFYPVNHLFHSLGTCSSTCCSISFWIFDI
jgi:hypothetical protein